MWHCGEVASVTSDRARRVRIPRWLRDPGEQQDPSPDDPPAGPRPPLRGLERLLLALAVVLPGCYVFWRISDSFRYYMDDYLQFSVALDRGLSWDTLGLNVFQHFGPVNRMLHLLVLRVGGFSLTSGMLAAAVLVVGLQLALLWLLRELGVSVGRTVLCLVAVGFSITVLDTAVWADAAFHIFPTLLVTTAVVAAHVRAVRTGRARWHVVTVLLFAFGTLTQERGLFALPMVVLANWFLLGAGDTFRGRIGRLRAALLPLAAMTLIAAGMAAFIFTVYAGGATTRPSIGTTVRTGLGALTEGIFPPWIGIRIDWLAPVVVQLLLLLLLAVIAGLLIWINRRNADALGFLAASFLLYYGFLAFSPILTADSVDGTALRLHNGTYLLMPTIVAVALLRWRRPGTVPARWFLPSARPWPAAVAAGLLAVALVLAGGQFTASHWYAERDGHAYLSAVAQERPVWSDPDVTVVPLKSPLTLVGYWAEAYGHHEHFLKFYDRDYRTRPLGDRPVVFDSHGQLRPVRLLPEAPLAVRGGQNCDPALRSDLRPPQPVQGEPLFLQLTYRTEAEQTVRVTAFSGDAPDLTEPFNWEVPLPGGEHTVVLPLSSDEVPAVALDWLDPPGSSRCVVDAQIVRPVFDDDGQCTGMTQYGEPTAATACQAGRPE